MPLPARWLGEVLPLTHYNRLCRAILLRGATVWELPGELAALALLFALGMAAATRLFQKRLD
jgi:ABC-2 type transport system permease protein